MNRERAPGSARTLLWLGALIYTALVMYGSLVPLEFRAIPWDDAVARFGAIPLLELGIGSRADWVTNLLLFIPLTALWMGALSAAAGRARCAAHHAAGSCRYPPVSALNSPSCFSRSARCRRTISLLKPWAASSAC